MDASELLTESSEMQLNLPVPLPAEFVYATPEVQSQIIAYIREFEDIDVIAYRVAQRQLGSSFHIVKSNGFQQWVKKNKK